jgi:hypothetical protein
MLRKVITLLIAMAISILAVGGIRAQTLFKEDFSTEDNEWESIVGTWDIKNEEYVGIGAGNHNYGELQDPTFGGDLTYEITATTDEKELQALGFGIWQDDQNYYIFWICGLTNAADIVRVSIGGAKTDWDTNPDACKSLRVRDVGNYRMKIVVEGDTMTTYVDGEEINEVEVKGLSNLEGKIRCTNWGGTTVAFDDLLVYGPLGQPVRPAGKIAVRWGSIKIEHCK